MNSNLPIAFPTNCVSLISKDLISLENVSESVRDAIVAFDARISQLEGRTSWKIPFSNRLELAEKFKGLNQLGFLFAGGPHGWPPAEVFADLRDKKLITGNFKEVRWRGPGNWFIIDR